jgi:hypothetical protein
LRRATPIRNVLKSQVVHTVLAAKTFAFLELFSVVPFAFAFAIVLLRPVERDDGEGEGGGPLETGSVLLTSLVSSELRRFPFVEPEWMPFPFFGSGDGIRAASVMLGFPF